MGKPKVTKDTVGGVLVKFGNNGEILLNSSILPCVYKFWPEPSNDSYARENLEKLFLNNSMRLTGPSEVNDPFDGNPQYITDLKGKNPAAEINRLIATTAITPEYKNHQDKLKSRFPNRKARRGADKSFQEFVIGTTDTAMRQHFERQGFISFSRDGYNPLLWAHYASAHKGIRIQFSTKLPDDAKTIDDLPIGLQLMKVRYTNARPSIRASKLSKDLASGIGGDELMDAILNKSKHWEYENEWRFIGSISARREPVITGNWVDIGPSALEKITLGVKCAPETEAFIRLLNEKSGLNIPINKAELSVREYKIIHK